MSNTLNSVQKYTLEDDGFIGLLYHPDVNLYPNKAVIMFGGSDGSFKLTKTLAQEFAKHGMTVLALAYWNEPGLPDHFEKIPIDFVEKAALTLKNEGIEKISLWGISMGAELALLSACLMPHLISSIVAVSPLNLSTQGFSKEGPRIKLLVSSCWSYRETEVPWTPLKFKFKDILVDMIRRKEPGFRKIYEDALLNADEGEEIPVEMINGPVLLISAQNDARWPSEMSSERMIKRLKKYHHPYNDKRLNYEKASHLLIPIKSRFAKIFKVERDYPEECDKSNQDAFNQTLFFWKEW